MVLLHLSCLAQFAWLPVVRAANCCAQPERDAIRHGEAACLRICDMRKVIACCTRAQIVGGRRVRQRRHKFRCLLSAVTASVVIDRHAFAVHDAGSRVGRWDSKCLQASILSLCPDSELEEKLRRKLLCRCQNHFGAGMNRFSAQWHNLRSVRKALCEVRKCVHVVVMGSSNADDAQCSSALWCLGYPGGESLGVVLWMVDAAHVLTCRGVHFKDLVHAPQHAWPWPKSVVGGPKKSPEQIQQEFDECLAWINDNHKVE